jgi:hypothetical protein
MKITKKMILIMEDIEPKGLNSKKGVQNYFVLLF